jgi:flagellar biosynthesis protein FlhF
MPEALAAVKRELGADAVILGTRTLPSSRGPGFARRDRVEITAAPPQTHSPAPRVSPPPSAARRAAPPPPPDTPQAPPPPPRPTAARPDLPQHLCRYYVELIQQNVAESLAERLVRDAAGQLEADGPPADEALRNAIRAYITRMMPDAAGLVLEPDRLRRVALVGPAGSGKTTMVAKLAALYKLRHEKRVALLTLDMHRLDGFDQLRRYAEALEIPLHVAQTIGEVREAQKSLNGCDLLVIDTPGIGLREQARFARLAALLRAARPDEIHLVLPASATPQVQARIAESFAPLTVTSVMLTRLDEIIGLGVILNTIERLSLNVSFLSTGQNVPHDIREACPQRVAELLCQPEK